MLLLEVMAVSNLAVMDQDVLGVTEVVTSVIRVGTFLFVDRTGWPAVMEQYQVALVFVAPQFMFNTLFNRSLDDTLAVEEAEALGATGFLVLILFPDKLVDWLSVKGLCVN